MAGTSFAEGLADISTQAMSDKGLRMKGTALTQAAANLVRGLLLACGLMGTAHALPVLVDYHDIKAATREDFQSYSGLLGTSFRFNGFTARGDETSQVLVVENDGPGCGAPGDRCLTHQQLLTNLGTDGGFLRFTFDDAITGRSLIQAVPAPGALALFALGVGGLLLFPRRRARLSA